MSDRLKVLYVTGAGRSGTTLLGKALGQFDAFCDVGELWALWRPAYANRALCGCGVPVPDCPFWSAVVRDALGENFEEEGRRIGAIHRSMMGTRRTARVWLQVHHLRSDADYQRYEAALVDHYQAIAAASGATVVVDTSKMVGDALLVSNNRDIDLYAVHVVRDPRGVAYSWAKSLAQPGRSGRAMPRHSAVYSSARWLAFNALAELLLRPRLKERFLRLRYEDFVSDPAAAIGRIVELVGQPAATMPVVDRPPAIVLTRPTHTVWGNPNRLVTGTVPLVADDEWRSQMARRKLAAATALAAPLLSFYRYPLCPPRPTDATGSRAPAAAAGRAVSP